MPSPELIKKIRKPPMGVDYRFAPWEKNAGVFLEDMKDVEIVRTADGLMFEDRKAFPMVVEDVTNPHVGFNGEDWGPIHTLAEWIEVDSDTGEKTSHPLLLSRGLLRVRKRELYLNKSGAYDIYARPTGIEAILTGGSGGFDITYLPSVTIGDVIDTLHATTSWTALVDNEAAHEAYVVGAQSNVVNITVDDGAGGAHSLVIGDYVTIGSAEYLITDVSATTISIDRLGGVTVADNDHIECSYRSFPAFHIKPAFYKKVGGSSVKIIFYDFVPVFYPVDGRLTGWPAGYNREPFLLTGSDLILPQNQGLDYWRHVSYENAAGCVYFAAPAEKSYVDGNGVPMTGILKYDGQNVYRAGMPKGVIQSVGLAGSGTGVDAGLHDYAITFEFVDNQGNVIEGQVSDRWTINVATAEDTIVTMYSSQLWSEPTLVKGAGYYLSNYAKVVGAQATTNIIQVDDGNGNEHSLHVGDTIYFYDAVEADYVTRTITAAQYDGGSGQITIDGAAVTVADNDPISANARIKIWRTAVGGSDLYLVATVVPDLSASTFTYTDSFSDATIVSNAKYLEPEATELHTNLDNVPSYLRLHEGSLVAAGSYDAPNTLHPSVPGLPEYFPALLESQIGENANDKITGLGKSGEVLVIGKKNSLWNLSGPILDPFNLLPAFRINLLSDGIGAASHESMVSSGEALYVLSEENVHPIRNGQFTSLNELGESIGIGLPVSPLFKNGKNLDGDTLLLHRACGVQHKTERLLIFNIPNERVLLSDTVDGSEESLVLVFFLDYGVWGTFNGGRYQAAFNGGAFWSDDGLWILNIHQGPTASNNVVRYLGLRSETGQDSIDYIGNEIDYTRTIWSENNPSFDLKTGFEFADGEGPNLNMLLKRLRIFSGLVDVTPSFDYTVDVVVNFQGDGGGFTGSLASKKEKLHRFKPQKAQCVQLRFQKDTTGSSDNYKVQLSGWQLEMAIRTRKKLELEARQSIG